MDCSDVNILLSVIDKQGLPLVILATLIYALWRLVKWVVPQIQAFAAEYLRLLEERNRFHVETAKRCQEQQDAILDTLTAMQTTLSKLGDNLP